MQVTKNSGNGKQSCLPTTGMEVVLDVFAVIMRLPMLMDKIRGEWLSAPLATVRPQIHIGEYRAEVSVTHIVATNQIALGQNSPIAQVTTRASSAAFYDFEELFVSCGAQIGVRLTDGYGKVLDGVLAK